MCWKFVIIIYLKFLPTFFFVKLRGELLKYKKISYNRFVSKQKYFQRAHEYDRNYFIMYWENFWYIFFRNLFEQKFNKNEQTINIIIAQSYINQ